MELPAEQVAEFKKTLSEIQDHLEKKDPVNLFLSAKLLERIAFRIYMMTDTGK